MQTSTALQELIAIELEARNFGFEWPHKEMIIDQAISECHEVLEAMDAADSPQHIQEEIGDLIHTAISLCLFAGFDVNETMALTAKKFTARIRALKDLALQQGLTNLADQSIDFQLQLWQQAKLHAKTSNQSS